MGNHRYSNGKEPYSRNKYQAQLNHQRAMRATDNEDKVSVNKNGDGYYISSRRLNDSGGRSPVQSARPQSRERNAYSGNASQTSYQSRKNGAYRAAPSGRRPEKKRSNSNRARLAVLTVAALLILAMVIFTVAQIIKSTTPDTPVQSAETTVPATQAQTDTTQETAEGSVTDALSFVTPAPEDNNADGESDNGFYVWNGAVYELFYGGGDSAVNYANALNGYAEALGKGIKTYAMIIPTHVEMGLPARFSESGEVQTSSQAENIKTAYENMSFDVTPVNCYNELASHCNEYIYFNTDHHWTGLGAYYAYSAFAKATNQEVLNLEDCTKQTVEGFEGTLLDSVAAELSADTVEYWKLPYETSNDIYYDSNGEPSELSVYYEGAEAGSLTYGVFIWGDQPLEVLRSDRGTGKKIAVIKESFGNAMVPYFTYNYDEVHVIDFRYWEGNLKSYCEENGITEVLFANGVMSANTDSQIEAMNTLF